MGEQRDNGVTLAELMVTIALASVLTSISIFGYRSLTLAQQEQGTARAIASMMRNAQERALSEAVTYCVAFDAGAARWRLYRAACDGTGTLANGPFRAEGKTSISAPSFRLPSGALTTSAYFYPRGTATPGSVTVSRANASKTYVISVEGLTARVSVAG
ncbi:MAG: GspH/FimT family pseudopilin [Frankia sp.]|nr:GspH/FimT family pseudopilin [Frankia sp.]